MAAAGQTPPPAGNNGTKGGMPMPSRNPLPLSASQEAQVREVFNARVRSHCADEIKGESEATAPHEHHDETFRM